MMLKWEAIDLLLDGDVAAYLFKIVMVESQVGKLADSRRSELG